MIAATALAQTANPAAGTTAAEPPRGGPANNEVFELSPFTVTASSDVGYLAAESLSGSRLRTSLRDIPAPISIFTEELLKDIDATSVEDVALYSLNAVEFMEIEIGGATGNQMLEQGDTANVNIRGQRATTTRNYFNWGLNTDNYNTTRVDISRGPNALLFGLSPGGGIANVTTKQAQMRDFTTAGFQISSYDSYRATLDLNKEIIDDKLALRINALKDDRSDWRPVGGKNSERLHVAGTFRPFKQTSIRAEMERGVVKTAKTNPWGPFDGISAWYAAGGDDFVATARAAVVANNGQAVMGGSATAPHFVAIQNNANPVIMDWSRMARSQWLGQNGLVAFPPTSGALGAGSYALFDFSRIPRETVSRGPGNKQDYDYSTQSIWLEQTVGRNLAFQVAYNKQIQDKLWTETTDWLTRIHVDVNTQLPDGTPNPHRGEYYIEETNQYTTTELDAETLQFTGTYELDSAKFASGTLAKLLGRHRIAGLYQEESIDDVRPRFVEVNTTPLAGNSGNTRAKNFIVRRTYLGSGVDPNIPFNTSGQIDPLTVPIAPQTVTTFLTAPATGTVTPGYIGDRVNASGRIIDTKLVVLQSFFWNNRVVTTFGYRRDDLKDRAATVTNAPTINAEVTGYTWDPYERLEHAVKRTQGGLIHVTKWMSLSYNQSDNFNLTGNRRDAFERRLVNEEGESKDWGVRFRLLDDRVMVALSQYESATRNRLTFTGASGTVRTQSNRIWDGLAQAGVIPLAPSSISQADELYRIDTNQSAGSTEDAEAKGTELEITGNLTKQWSLTLNASRGEVTVANAGKEDFLYIQTQWDEIWSQHAAVAASTPINANNPPTVGETHAFVLDDLVTRNDSINGAPQKGTSKYRANLITTYRFAEGPLKGFSVGGAARYTSRAITFARLSDPTDPASLVLFRGSPSYLFDLWFGYKTAIVSGKYKLDFRLNFKNLFDKDDYRIITHDQNGNAQRGTFITPRTISFSTSVTF